VYRTEGVKPYRIGKFMGERGIWWIVYEGDTAVFECLTEDEARKTRNEWNQIVERMGVGHDHDGAV